MCSSLLTSYSVLFKHHFEFERYNLLNGKPIICIDTTFVDGNFVIRPNTNIQYLAFKL